MISKHRFEIRGNVGKEPEMRFTPSGQAVCTFSVAVNEQYTNKAGEQIKQTMWVRVQTWGKSAENCNQYVKKGMLVECEGKLQFDPVTGSPKLFERQDGSNGVSFEMNAYRIDFLSRVDSASEPQQEVVRDTEEVPF
jgi:single-strand DNA-binding protein